MNDSVKRSLIDRIIDARLIRFEEQGKLVDNGLGAQEIFFASDCAVGLDETLRHKCLRSVDYAMSISDNAVFNAFQYMVPEAPANSSVMAGFYLMLADTVSRNPTGKTFLTAMREAGAELRVDVKDITPEIKKDLYEKTLKALETLGILDKCGPKVKEWYEKGMFTFANIPHGITHAKEVPLREGDDPTVPRPKEVHLPESVGTYRVDTFKGQELVNVEHGPYTELAYLIFKLEPDFKVSVNVDISVAMGNREAQKSMGPGATEEQVLEKHLKPLIDNAKLLEDRYQIGRLLRAERMYDAVKSVLTFTQEQVDLAADAERKRRPDAVAILNYFPAETLRYIEERKLTFAYTNEGTIRNIYPAEDPSGLSAESVELTRKSIGGRLSRYDTLFISHGLGGRPADLVTEEEKRNHNNLLHAQTSLHELFHDMFSAMPDTTRTALVKLVDEIQGELKQAPFSPEPLRTMTDTNLNQLFVIRMSGERYGPGEMNEGVLNFYQGYPWAGYDKDSGQLLRAMTASKQEELLCNFYSFMNTELKDNPVLQTPALQKLKTAMDAAIQALTNKGQTMAAGSATNKLDVRNASDQHGHAGAGASTGAALT